MSPPAPHDCAAGGPFFYAATKIRIGRGRLLLCDGCGRGRCHSCGFLLRIMPPSWHPVPACARHDHFAGGPFFFAATKIRVGCRHLLLCDGCGRAGATPAAFYLGLCRLRGILSLPASHDCAAGGPFSFAATKNRIGRGALLLCDGCGRAGATTALQAGRFLSPLRLCCSDSQVWA